MSPMSPAKARRKSSRDRSRSILRLAPSSMSAPWASKKRISTVAASSGLRRTVTPPWARSERTWNRVRGTGASSRSSTWTPDRLRPDITARLSVRADPGGVPGTAHDRTLLEAGAVGGGQADGQLGGDVDVGQAPHPPAAEQRALPPALPHDRGVDDRPRLDGLVGVDLDALVDDGAVADEALLAEDDALLGPGPPPQVGRPADDAAPQRGGRPDVDVVVDDRPRQGGVVLHHHVGAEHGVFADAGPGLDPAVVADDDRAGDLGRRVDVGSLARARSRPPAGIRGCRPPPARRGRRGGPGGRRRWCRRPPSSRRPRAPGWPSPA